LPIEGPAKDPVYFIRERVRDGPTIRNYFYSLDFRPNVVMRSDSSEAIKAMIRAGLGSVLFLWNIDAETNGSPFKVIRTDAPPLSLRMALIRSGTGYRPKAAIEFIQLAGHRNWKNLHLPPYMG
jgi:DNA-binding transcriptional LysR family regulator